MAKIVITELQDKITHQQALAERIRLLQEEERSMRAEILEELFGNDNVGTIKAEVGNFIVTGTYGLTYSIHQDDIDLALETGELSAEAMNAIRVKYELNKKVYDNLSDEASSEINDFLTIKPSLPSIKVKVVADE